MKISDMNGNDHLEDNKRVESILTGHGQYYLELETRCREALQELKDNEIKITRYKIEDALMDSRFNDVWGFLT